MSKQWVQERGHDKYSVRNKPRSIVYTNQKAKTAIIGLVVTIKDAQTNDGLDEWIKNKKREKKLKKE